MTANSQTGRHRSAIPAQFPRRAGARWRAAAPRGRGRPLRSRRASTCSGTVRRRSFEPVAGHRLKLTGNPLNSLPRIAAGLRTDRAGLQHKIVEAIARPLRSLDPRRTLPGNRGRRPRSRKRAADPDLFEEKIGPSFTAGAIVARDRAIGACNLSFARLNALGGNRALIGIAPNHHLAIMARASMPPATPPTASTGTMRSAGSGNDQSPGTACQAGL
jgi:hypothetical protein